MASSRRLSNGRSPLVRKQNQITHFFTPDKSPGGASGSNPTCGPDPSPSQSQSQSQSQLQQEKKMDIVFPTSDPKSPPSTAAKVTAEEVVDRRIKVFWPPDKTCNKGRVLPFDAQLGMRPTQYDDAEEEEVLDPGREKFDRVEDKENEDKGKEQQRLRRLRRLSGAAECGSAEAEVEDRNGIEDSTDEEGCNKNGRKGAERSDSEEEVESEDSEKVVVSSRKSRSRSKSSSIQENEGSNLRVLKDSVKEFKLGTALIRSRSTVKTRIESGTSQVGTGTSQVGTCKMSVV